MTAAKIRITDVDVVVVDLPLPKPLRTAIHEIRRAATLLVTVRTDAGLVGEGYGFCFDMERMRSIAAFANSLKKMFVGRDPFHVEGIWDEMLRSCNFYGQGGVAVLAMNPLDIACWDIIGKAANRPLYQLWGACRDRVPVYASAGLWMSSDLGELRREAAEFLETGFKAMKVRLGSKRWQDDVARVEAVRDVIGPDIALMADSNQGLELAQALKLGQALERFELRWYEEPLPTWQYEQSAQIARTLDTPLANGETEWTRYGIRKMLAAGAADIMMPDLQRMGGYTEMRKAMGLLAAHDMPIAPHIFTEHSLHLVASESRAIYAEHMPWFERLFHERMTVEADGMVALPQAPGVGFTFDWNAIDAFRVD
jgi:L-alanine-DL-glutamate epimerase-like enolase superfamily enzyme